MTTWKVIDETGEVIETCDDAEGVLEYLVGTDLVVLSLEEDEGFKICNVQATLE